MPESSPVGIKEIGRIVNDARPNTFPQAPERDEVIESARERAWDKGIFEMNRREVGEPAEGKEPEYEFQEPTVGTPDNPGDILKRMTKISIDLAPEVQASVEKVTQQWEKLGEKAASPEFQAEDQMEALSAADRSVSNHEKAQSAHDALAQDIVDAMSQEAFNPQSPLNKLISLRPDSASYRDLLGVGRDEVVTPEMVKTDPRFAQFRADVVTKVQALSQEYQGAGVWAGIKLATKFNHLSKAGRDSYHNTVKLFSQAKDVQFYQDRAKASVPLEAARSYHGQFGEFLVSAGVAVKNQAVLDAMPIVTEEFANEQQADINAHISRVWDQAAAENEKFSVNRQAEAFARGELEAFADSLEEGAMQHSLELSAKRAAEKAARRELGDLEFTAIELGKSADQHAELASMGLTALHELGYSEAKIKAFNDALKDGKLPAELQGIIGSDMGKELDAFVQSGGKKGSVEAIRKLIGSTSNPGELAQLMSKEDGDGFLVLNTLQEEANKDRVVQTGITATVAEDGTWQFRFATRQNGKIEVNQEIAVVNLKPETIYAVLSTVDAQEASLTQAKKVLAENQSKLEAALAIKSTSPDIRKRRKDAVKSSEKQVEALNASLLRSKAELAQELKVTNANVTLGKAFEQMAAAQQQVAENFYSADFRDMVLGISEELGMAPDKVTADVLATLVVEARHASEQAGAMAEYFNIAQFPQALEARVIDARLPEMDDLAAEFAELKHQQSIVAELADGPAKEKASREHKKAEKELNRRATEFGKILNKDFLDAIPAPLRKGVGAVKLSDAKFKQQAAVVLDEAGFDTTKYLKRDAAVAMRVRASLPYTSELQSLVRHASDALVEIDNVGRTPTLLKALEGGDVEGFLRDARSILSHSTERQFGVIQNEVNARRLAEIFSTPEGIIEAMKTGELAWQTAVDKVMNGDTPTGPVLEGLRALEQPAVLLEAARRFQVKIAQIIADAGNPSTWTEGSPLAGQPDLAAQMKFIDEATGGSQHEYWAFWQEFALAEKKTPVAAE